MSTGRNDGYVGYPSSEFGTEGQGTLRAIPSQKFTPVNGQGQSIAFGAVSVASLALTANRAHHLFCESNTCWIRVVAGNAAAGDFPMALGVVYEFTPTAAGTTVKVIQRSGAGNLLIGQSEL